MPGSIWVAFADSACRTPFTPDQHMFEQTIMISVEGMKDSSKAPLRILGKECAVGRSRELGKWASRHRLRRVILSPRIGRRIAIEFPVWGVERALLSQAYACRCWVTLEGLISLVLQVLHEVQEHILGHQ